MRSARRGAATRVRASEGTNGSRIDADLNYDLLLNLVGFWIRRAEVKVLRSFAHYLEPLGVTPTEVAALILIGANRGLSQTALAGALATDQSTVVNLLTGLERRGLISRTRDQQDRRYHVLSLTPDGRTTLRAIKSALARHDRTMQAALSDDEKSTLMASLRRFVET